jgi:hypothetical protein
MKKYLIFIIPLLVFTSCKKFLDVQPESDVTKEQLFSTEDGFEEALKWCLHCMYRRQPVWRQP